MIIENIFVDGNKVLLGDFGLARTIGHPISQKTYQKSPTTLNNVESSSNQGTYLYTAPEILLHEQCTTKADIYSFGILFFEIFSLFSTGMERAKV